MPTRSFFAGRVSADRRRLNISRSTWRGLVRILRPESIPSFLFVKWEVLAPDTVALIPISHEEAAEIRDSGNVAKVADYRTIVQCFASTPLEPLVPGQRVRLVLRDEAGRSFQKIGDLIPVYPEIPNEVPLTRPPRVGRNGAVYIPQFMRATMGLQERDEIEIEMLPEKDGVVIRKARPVCALCGRRENSVKKIGNKFVCAACIAALKEEKT